MRAKKWREKEQILNPSSKSLIRRTWKNTHILAGESKTNAATPIVGGSVTAKVASKEELNGRELKILEEQKKKAVGQEI